MLGLGAATVARKQTMGDDTNDCSAMGGFTWCEALATCVRAWITPCPDTLEIDAPTPTHNVTSVPTTVPVPGHDHDKDDDTTVGTVDGARVIALLCTIIAVGLSLHLIRGHLRNYVKPQRQRYVIRIVWMVPIYAMNSFLSLCFIEYAPVFDVPRDVYESYVLYNFVALLIDYMGGEGEAKAFFAAQPPQKHWWPFHWLGDHDMSVFLETTRLCVLQYSIVRPVTAFTTLFLYFGGDWDDTDWYPNSANLWIMVINNISVSIALMYLVYFYHATLPCESLQRAKPLLKFVAVKLIVFFCFWQSMVISLLVSFGVITRRFAHKDDDKTTTGLNDFVICVEMAFFALLHECVFSWREHTRRDDGIGTTPLQRALTYDQAFRDMFFVGDVTADLGRIICEAPTVCWRGGKRVRQAQREREARRQQQARHKMELPPHEEEKQAASPQLSREPSLPVDDLADVPLDRPDDPNWGWSEGEKGTFV